MGDEVGLITFSLTAGSAFLLQTMDPTVAAVVGEHSTFRTDPVGRATRSLASVMMWGPAADLGRIRGVFQRCRGKPPGGEFGLARLPAGDPPTRRPGAPAKLPRALAPLWRVALDPIGRVQHFVTVGTTPETARRKLGLSWTEADERRLRALAWVIRHPVPLLPERLRYFPIAYQARRLERPPGTAAGR